ncbi:hypothetical protein FEM48_ZijujUnG0115400 [Ziziphus jujuba var. spinosa]|uniref:Protoporphyrinogen oxidase n=1 Tax=Ziziphus jujuba var. spinosa TaxID=714518 RepID=A0A978U7Y6_ZIZJJ|nr:hypothetical protein FEM48_ZijujUnG0115400 [Ziziphus jujuba var. spinosa]
MGSAKIQDQPSSAKRVAVVGAGVSGLAAAYKLKSHGLNVTVFEAGGRTGGKLRSVSHDGLIWDEGANTMTQSEIEVQSLLDDLGLREKQQFPISQNKRYIVRDGSPVLIPTNPLALIKSNILSTKSKFEIILEPFLWKKRSSSDVSDHSQESVGGFFQRHFGKEVVDYLIDPFVAGTSAGDPESLSVMVPYAYAFVFSFHLVEVEMNENLNYALTDCYFSYGNALFFSGFMESRGKGVASVSFDNFQIIYSFRFGSFIAGAIQSKLSSRKEKSGEKKGSLKKTKHQCGSFSFKGGMQTLADTLSKEIGVDEIKLNSKVLSLSYCPDGKSARENWSVSFAAKHVNHSQALSVDAVIVTVSMICPSLPRDTSICSEIWNTPGHTILSYMPLSVIITTFKKENVKRPLEGFGVLVPSKEQNNGLNNLGNACYHLYDGKTCLILRIYSTHSAALLSLEVYECGHFYWKKAFPLYGYNYDSVIAGIEKMEKNPSWAMQVPNQRGGLPVGKAIASECKAAELVISYLESSSDGK